MSKAKNKTQATTASAADYLAAIDDDKRRTQCETVSDLMARITKRPATMWGPSIVGFGKYHYQYDSGREIGRARVGKECRSRWSPYH